MPDFESVNNFRHEAGEKFPKLLRFSLESETPSFATFSIQKESVCLSSPDPTTYLKKRTTNPNTQLSIMQPHYSHLAQTLTMDLLHNTLRRVRFYFSLHIICVTDRRKRVWQLVIYESALLPFTTYTIPTWVTFTLKTRLFPPKRKSISISIQSINSGCNPQYLGIWQTITQSIGIHGTLGSTLSHFMKQCSVYSRSRNTTLIWWWLTTTTSKRWMIPSWF